MRFSRSPSLEQMRYSSCEFSFSTSVKSSRRGEMWSYLKTSPGCAARRRYVSMYTAVELLRVCLRVCVCACVCVYVCVLFVVEQFRCAMMACDRKPSHTTNRRKTKQQPTKNKAQQQQKKNKKKFQERNKSHRISVRLHLGALLHGVVDIDAQPVRSALLVLRDGLAALVIEHEPMLRFEVLEMGHVVARGRALPAVQKDGLDVVHFGSFL